MGFLATTETAITTGFTAVANTFGSGLLSTFKPAFVIGFTVWITLIAYEVAFGKSEDAFTYLFTKIGKIFLIGVCALYGWPELADLLNAVKDGFVGGTTISTILEAQLMNPIEALFAALWTWFYAAMAPLGITDIAPMFRILISFTVTILAYSVMSVLVAVFAAIVLAMYLVANTIFILLLAVGPFFLLCLAFPFLQRFFETYIGNVVTSILAMGFTILMVFFVTNLFGLLNINTIVPAAIDIDTVTDMSKQMAVLFASKAAMSLLIIYLFYKVFDLAAALGGGLNMGNNMVGGVRAVMRDLQRNAGSGSASRVTNSISQGRAGGGSGGGASQRARRANSTFTGAAASAVTPAVSAAGRTAIAGASNLGRMASYGAGRAAATVGRYAYNRYSQNTNRISAG